MVLPYIFASLAWFYLYVLYVNYSWRRYYNSNDDDDKSLKGRRRCESSPRSSSAENADLRGQSPSQISQCPNPNCVRCRRYQEINTLARRRLPAIEARFGIDDNENSDNDVVLRIVDAVRRGPPRSPKVGVHGEDYGDNNNVSPVRGQYPTVLLVGGLTARPIVTDFHPRACRRFLEGDGDDPTSTWRVLFEEYWNAHQQQERTKVAWLQNDTSSPAGVSNSDDVATNSNSWSVLHILNQGIWNETNASACPRTAALVRSIPGGIKEGCVFGNAFYSVLEPGTVVEPHCGPTNVRHRLHYGIEIPNNANTVAFTSTGTCERGEGEADDNHDAAVLTVLDRKVMWETNGCFVFDDSLLHSVEYSSSGSSKTAAKKRGRRRVVLIVDLWHPELTEEERSLITELYPSSAVSETYQNHYMILKGNYCSRDLVHVGGEEGKKGEKATAAKGATGDADDDGNDENGGQ